MAKVVQIYLETLFGSHIYQCSNTLYRQTTGGAISARITGIVARILMNRWADAFTDRLRKAGVDIPLLVKYVDDCILAISLVPKGNKWVKTIK